MSDEPRVTENGSNLTGCGAPAPPSKKRWTAPKVIKSEFALTAKRVAPAGDVGGSKGATTTTVVS